MQHCETTALGVLLRHEGMELSEPMLFGLGAGLSFVYWDSKAMDFPFLGGRVKPFELTRNLAARLGLDLDVRETASAKKAWQNIVEPLDAGRPVGLQLDCYHLAYFTSKVHFGGHVVAMRGYDDAAAHLTDTEQQGGEVSTSLASLGAARAERGPMTARNRSFTLTVPPGAPEPRSRIAPAIRACAEAFLNPPIANLGHRGIDKAAQLVPKWRRREGHHERDLPQIADLMERAGTGGALFRNLYRDFLAESAESAELIDDAHLRAGHAHYTEAATRWTEVAALIAKGSLDGAGSALADLARLEREAMTELRQVGA
ncbi:BtrH N-terminal domain-containing protein [Streptomyces sp. A7024]|uniref:BtrH N-terminal domain-containing protein n=1 Tax=Streptomyces coryli TaxID=1128680 RepID=A0A6G4U8P7_9ACTN|nr:BtrH N-terminal domain-containing protein [Streptomyces coryli]NGN68100.1 BtrH N-terminal domain-containing protein [Streptomyces coryli]